jgi:hypothetical protein
MQYNAEIAFFHRIKNFLRLLAKKAVLYKTTFTSAVKLDSSPDKFENFSLTVSLVWLLVRAVAGGVSDGYSKNKHHFQRAFSPNK